MKHEEKVIGIVGGGQLGRMLTDAAHSLGFKVIILDPTPGSPASQLADEQLVGSFKDIDKIRELAEKSDYITFEIESANSEALEELVKNGVPVNPSPTILRIIKDKFEQKVFLKNQNIPVADFVLVQSKKDCIEQGKIFGYPYLLKARFDAYDGRGNFVIKNENDIAVALEKFSGNPLYAEKFIPFIKELAVISARDNFDTIISYPVVETIHKNNICHIVRFPAQVDKTVAERATELAQKVIQTLDGIGVFAVEMFLTADNQILINEIAPRVHNSGHLTIEAFTVSQFEQHIRAIAGLPLEKPEAKVQAAVMVNILGEREGEAIYKRSEDLEPNLANGGFVHIYGKMETKKERKMGHITVVGDSVEEAERKAFIIRKNIAI